MKNLLNLTLALLTTVLIASCGIFGSDGSKDEKQFEPYKIGSFKVTSPTEAEYIGVSGNEKLYKVNYDSVVIDSIGHYQLTLKKDTVTGRRFRINFVDSTFTSQPDSIDISSIDIEAVFTNLDEDIISTPEHNRTWLNDEHIMMELGVFYQDCNDTGEDVETDIEIKIYEDANPANIYKKYLIKTNKLTEVAFDITCN